MAILIYLSDALCLSKDNKYSFDKFVPASTNKYKFFNAYKDIICEA